MPPSPWRLLRALAARWFQYSRETGDVDVSLRDAILRKLGREVPQYQLPKASWRGLAIKQYQPVGLGDQYKYKTHPATKKKVLDYSFKSVGTTLVEDHYRAVPHSEPIWWVWGESTTLDVAERELLDALLRRMLYFGRSESYCRIAVDDAARPVVNCQLTNQVGTGNPVLVAQPESELNLEVLLATTDGDVLKPRRIPPGTAWYYATIPLKQIEPRRHVASPRHPDNVRVLQFAVGGRVYPPPAHWVKLTERFRSAVIRQRCEQVSGGRVRKWSDLTDHERTLLRLIRGANANGSPVEGNQTAFLALLPDETGLPTQMVCWRSSPFSADEIDAFMAATEFPLSWDYGSEDWQVRLVALPFNTPPLSSFWGEGRVWVSSTPFVLPAGRRRFRRNGRRRAGETPVACRIRPVNNGVV